MFPCIRSACSLTCQPACLFLGAVCHFVCLSSCLPSGHPALWIQPPVGTGCGPRLVRSGKESSAMNVRGISSLGLGMPTRDRDS